jgi:uncharacterized membrane protein
MGRGRLEAFSDGVIAILITIMVLELKVPEVSAGAGDIARERAGTFAALYDQRHVFLAYVLSFVYLGIYWNNHHHMLHTVQRVSGSVLWANLHLLFWLSLVPFTTEWMGRYHDQAHPAAIYGVVLVCAAISYTILQARIVAVQGPDSTLAHAVGRDRKGKLSIGLYLLGIGLAFVHPLLANGCYALVALIWLVPDRRIEKRLAE